MQLELTPVVRYWEFNNKEISERLEKLRDQGVRSVAAWIPWSNLETDRHHSLQKFVRAAFKMGLKIKLGVTPELGIGYWNNGLPEDLLQERTMLAQDRTGQLIFNCAPPNIHALPSLSAPAVFQRYGHYLLKLVQELNEVLYEMPQHSMEFVVSDSLFKHYRTAGLAPEDHGDFSIRYLHQNNGAGVSQGANPSGAESIFINRTKDFLTSRFAKYKNVKVLEQRVFGRMASLERLMEEMTRSGANLPALFKEMAQARCHSQMVWLDDLYGLSDRERNFLISSALVMYQRVWLSEDVFQLCSSAFRRRLVGLVEGFSREETEQTQTATVFVQNRFAPARLSQALRDKLGSRLTFENTNNLSNKQKAKLLVVEEGISLEYEQYMALQNLARKQPCTVVLFKSALDQRAIRDLQLLKKMHIKRNWSYDIVLYPHGGQILIVEGQEGSEDSLSELAQSVVSVAQLEPWCQLSRPSEEVYSISIDWQESEGQAVKTLFLLNPTETAVPLTMGFSQETRIQGIFFGGEQKIVEPLHGDEFEGSLPAFSVVPLTAYLAPSSTLAQVSEENEDARSSTKLA